MRGDAAQTGHLWCDWCPTRVGQCLLFPLSCAYVRAHTNREKTSAHKKTGSAHTKLIRHQRTLSPWSDGCMDNMYNIYIRCLKHFYVDKLVKFLNSYSSIFILSGKLLTKIS